MKVKRIWRMIIQLMRESEPYPNEYKFGKRADVPPAEKLVILLRWQVFGLILRLLRIQTISSERAPKPPYHKNCRCWLEVIDG